MAVPFLFFLILVGLNSPLIGDDGFLKNRPCQEHMAKLQALGNLEKRYPSPLPPGPEREEFYARQMRLEWMRDEFLRVRSRHQNGMAALTNFGKALAWEVDPPVFLWRQAIRDMTYQRYGQFLPDDSFMEFAARVPDFLGFRSPPRLDQFRVIRDLSQAITELTEYRYFISQRLVVLPLDTHLTAMAPRVLQDALSEGLGYWNERPTDASSERDGRRAYFLSSAYEVEVLETALLALPKLPPALRSEIQRHADFLRKYQFQPDSIYLGFLQAVETYLR